MGWAFPTSRQSDPGPRQFGPPRLARMSDEPDRHDQRPTIAWYKVYLVLVVVSIVFVGLTQAEVGPFGELDPFVVAGIIAVVFALVSVAYWYDVYRR